jgi:signal transduction histidine kinase
MSAPLDVSRRTIRLGKWELLLDFAAVAAAIFEVGDILRAGSWAAVPILVIALGAVVARRHFPITAAVAAVLASGLVLLLPANAVPIWVLAEVVLFTLALRARRWITLLLAGTHAVVLYVGAVVVFGDAPFEPVALLLPVWTAAVVATGLALRANDDYVRALEEQHRSALAYRDSEVQRHVGEERLRIARDLHDSVAHTVSIIAVHAGAAERFLERDPARSRESLNEVRASSRAVISELQDVLSVLRGRDRGDDITEAVPGIEGFDALIRSTRDAGVEVRAHVSLALDIDRTVSVAAYRIAQESLTNARKHGAGDADIEVSVSGDQLLISVSNALTGEAPTGEGFGLLGMHERAASVHGFVRTGVEGNRFLVRAALPTHPHQRVGAGS